MNFGFEIFMIEDETFFLFLTLTLYHPAMPFGNRKKNILEDLFSSVLSQFKKYPPSGNLKFNHLGIFQSLKLRILMEKSVLFLLS